jgi:hypothetical protein
MKSPRVRILGVAAILIFLAAAVFVIYGLRTDCAHTSGYVNCSETDDKP